MRQVTEKIRFAFYNGEKLKISNDETRDLKWYLHGNLIAKIENGSSLWITNCGWFSNTTKERLNSLYGVSIVQKSGIWYLNGEKWDGNWIQIG